MSNDAHQRPQREVERDAESTLALQIKRTCPLGYGFVRWSATRVVVRRPRTSGVRPIILGMSDEIELAAKSTGAVVGAVIEASGVAKPLQEVTGWLASWMHPRFVASAAKQVEAAARKLEAAGIRPGAVRDEQMRGLLEDGAREEDQMLSHKWANLLATGVAGGAAGVPRAYSDVLRQLEPVEVLLLDKMGDGEVALTGSVSGTRMATVGLGDVPLSALVNLERLGLAQLGAPAPVRFPQAQRPDAEVMRGVQLTAFGVEFVRACRGPEPAE